MDRKIEPVGLVTSLDVREQGGGLRNRTNVLNLGYCNKGCFLSREFEKPSPEKGPRGEEDGEPDF